MPAELPDRNARCEASAHPRMEVEANYTGDWSQWARSGGVPRLPPSAC